MDYERIQKPQGGGGFSPGKLRSMLLGVEKKRKQEEELDSNFTPRSQSSDMDESGGSSSDCKYVDVVSVHPEYSTSTDRTCSVEADSNDRLAKANAVVASRNRILEDPSLDYDSGYDNMIMSPSMFEFQKAERAPPRVPVGPFSKPAPSKWDDAQKWIASPTSNRPKTAQNQGQGGHAIPRKVGGLGSRQPSMKVVVEVPDQKEIALDEPDTKQIDANQTKMEGDGQKFVNWDDDPYAIANAYGVSLSQHNSSIAAQSATTFVPPPSTARSVSMRDMGTEMTPIASQEPSRTGTPVGATTPMRSPNSSRPSTPTRAAPSSNLIDPRNDNNKNELSEKELQMKTRREIMVLGTQLGKMNIAAWASKEEEDKDASTSLKIKTSEQPVKSVVEARATAWEEAEKAKYMARFRREEMKIQAWENHQKAKTEAKMRKVEVEVERIRSKSHDKLMNKLAAARHKAEEKRAAAEANRNHQATKTEEQAEYIRRTGHVPSSYFSFSCCTWCS
ncbi:remorin 4.1 isoform X1 [Trifolium pratense]|uniref:Uncharacterized protein n=5 Tax=Trifolium TaxID=3898 RepID=A0ACB0MBF9_TRIPR|nr:remorin 4.1 isoform X1 [Trifolium pratense]CAJ2677783.1 unnamed protein product [Trifolium pratense]